MSRVARFLKKWCCCDGSSHKAAYGAEVQTESPAVKQPTEEISDEAIVRMMQQLMGASDSTTHNNATKTDGALNDEGTQLTCEELALEYVSAAFKALANREGFHEPDFDQFYAIAQSKLNTLKMQQLGAMFCQKPTEDAKQRAFELGCEVAQEILREMPQQPVIEEIEK